MTDWVGRFGRDTTPLFAIRVNGPSGNSMNFDAILDTGFTGFLLLPSHAATQLNVPMEGMQEITLADGSQHLRFRGSVIVQVEDEERTGRAIFEPYGEEVIVGMRFLTSFKRGLTVLPAQGIVLLPQDTPLE